ncbi:hypothetical protein [Micromonospora sp. NBC_01796]|uniref:hypothetical protein n=1 Tax=Micromonospora sp. NBC_01796 TaxID=2975987 RepID=UPI002DDB7243|nr:hypothetical protein [Micromonospora sp. NBC_01796]WSA84353.1 hypothetical protein OIE47_28930 [Micromonospora sp. NBC_01796]
MRTIIYPGTVRQSSTRTPQGTPRSRTPRRAAVMAALLGLTAALIGMTASPASASIITVQDGFEGTQAANWSFTHVGDGTGGVSLSQPHNGIRSGFVSMRGAGFSSVSRRVSLPPTTSCTAGIHVNPALATQQVNFEIINPVNFTYVALRTVVLSGDAPYTFVSTEWKHGPTDVLVRVSLIGNASGTTLAAWVDDLGILCQT